MGDLRCPVNDDIWNDLDDELAVNHLHINGDDDDRAPTDLVQATETARHAMCARAGMPMVRLVVTMLPTRAGYASP